MPLQESLYCPECFRRYAAGHAYCPEHGARLVLLPGEPSLAGQVVAERYHIAVELGVGGIGVVYRAEHALIHRDLALKVFRRFLAEDPAAMPRLEAVTDAALRLRGPCTIRVYDAGLTGDGRLFLARELALRPSLRELLDREGPLRPATALRMAVGVARALEEAHTQGLLHRGLSPGNIFPGISGDEVPSRVSDFGHAALLVTGEGIRPGPAGLACAALEYSAPEQAAGMACDVAADLYALGACLFEALAGQPPFRAGTPLDLLERIVQAPRPTLREIAGRDVAPPAVEDLVRRLLSRRTRERPADAAALRSELEALLRDPELERFEGGSGGARVAASVPSPEPGPPTAGPAPGAEPEPAGADGEDVPLVPPRSRLPVLLALLGIAAVVVVLAALGVFSGTEEGPAPPQDDTLEASPEDVETGLLEPAAPEGRAGGPRRPRDRDGEPPSLDHLPVPGHGIPAPGVEVPSVRMPVLIGPGEVKKAPEVEASTAPEVPPEGKKAPPGPRKPSPTRPPDDKRPPTETAPETRPEPSPAERTPPEPSAAAPKPTAGTKPSGEEKPQPALEKPRGMDEEDFRLAKEQVAWGRKNMTKQLWEMAILNFEQAQRMGLTDPAISGHIRACRNHMEIVADAMEKGHAAFDGRRWDEAIRQFQRARDHGEKGTTTFRLIEQAKEAKAAEEDGP